MRYLVVAVGLAGCARGGMDVFDAPAGGDDSRRGGSDAFVPQDAPDATVPHPGTHLLINEVDYDQIGTDSAEYIELFNPTAASASLAGVSVMLVNGLNNTVYATVDISSVASLGPGQYLVLAGNAVTVGGAATRFLTGWTSDAVQNGPPDGIALVDTNAHTVIDALSYEGAITAAMLTGFSQPVSLVEGTALATSVADSNTVNGTLCRRPDGQDTDDANADWKFCTTVTPGTANM